MYKFKPVDDQFVERFFSLVDPKSKLYLKLKARGGYFNNYGQWMNYVINPGNGNFLVVGPDEHLMTKVKSFYFCFEDKLYAIRIESPVTREAEVIQRPDTNKLKEFRDELEAAFAVHGYDGVLDGFMAVEIKDDE
ncbi:hypothetical protein [Reinekea sp. G2M2-21]|uniref:hypothetical protein n=1 Tax=Reinekea sp. G2M2-21 TaxID=2788942 RepID=UPI0018A91D03|nr:hypothetical protein [Reinekea sp. G2M2-21]